MGTRQFVLTPRHLRCGLWIALCAPFASGLADEPFPSDLPARSTDSQTLEEDPPLGGAPISAAPVPAGRGVVSYPARFFKEFQPATALDMVKRLPGFTFDQGDTTIRGFAGALGNVLIDGKRPASKTVALEDVLRRIPVSNVAAVEVIRGGAPGINMQGRSVLANIVRLSGDMSSHAGEITGMLAAEHDPGVELRLESSRSSGQLALNGAVNFQQEQQYGDSGSGSLVRRDPGGDVIAASDFETDWSNRHLQANGLAEYDTGPGQLRVNIGGINEDTKQLDVLVPRADAPGSIARRVATTIRRHQGEAGLDYEHLFTDALSGHMLLLQSLEKEIISADASSPQTLQSSEDESLRGESILRSSMTYRFSPRLTIEGGLEGAYNFLDVDASLRLDGAPVPLPADNVEVKERRAETFVDARWQLSPRLSGNIGVRYEVSTISQSGDHNARRTLSYPKPRALLTWNLDGGLQLRGRIERTVSQLEFRDFASQASLDAGTISGGNAQLRPETAWELEGTIEKRFWDSAMVSLSYMHSIVSDVVDLMPIGGFDTTGNIGDGTRGHVELSLSLPFDRFGMDNTLLRLNSTWSWSQVADPVTYQSRSISEDSPLDGNLLLTREFPALSSTLSLEDSYSNRDTSYRLGEIRTERWDHFFRLYWDWTPKPNTVLRLMFNNVTGRPRSRWRTVYEGSRAMGLIAYREDRHIDALRFVQIQLRKTF